MSFDENTPDNILGQEFLTWLWYRSDSNPQAFTDTDGTPFSVSLEQRITVEGGQGEERETTAVSGALSPLREARVGLATGKKVTRALLLMSKEEMNFSVTLKAESFAMGSMKTPKVEKPEEDDDPEFVALQERLEEEDWERFWVSAVLSDQDFALMIRKFREMAVRYPAR